MKYTNNRAKAGLLSAKRKLSTEDQSEDDSTSDSSDDTSSDED